MVVMIPPVVTFIRVLKALIANPPSLERRFRLTINRPHHKDSFMNNKKAYKKPQMKVCVIHARTILMSGSNTGDVVID